MSKTITLSLRKSLILEAVKADTYQSGQVDKAADPVKNASLAYNESAGDEEYQERMLTRMLRSGIARFATCLAEFIDSKEGSIGYTITDGAENDDITVSVVVSDRYNNGLAKPLSSLAEEFVIYSMCHMWWQSKKPALAKDYFSYGETTLTYIRLCLAKTAPSSSGASYNDVNGTVTGDGIVSVTFPNQVYAATMGQAFSAPAASTVPGGLSLTYSSSDTEVATVDETTGAVTLVAAGNAVITASFAGNSTYAAASGSYTLNVNPAA